MSNSPDILESIDFPEHIPSSLPSNLHFPNTDSGPEHVLKSSCGLTQLSLTPARWGRCQVKEKAGIWTQKSDFKAQVPMRTTTYFSTQALHLVLMRIYLTALWAFIYFSISLNPWVITANCLSVFILPSSSPLPTKFYLSTWPSALDYISQHPLQLDMAMWLSSGQWDVSGSSLMTNCLLWFPYLLLPTSWNTNLEMQNSKKPGSVNDFVNVLCQLCVLALGIKWERNKLLSYLAILLGDLRYSNFSYMLDSAP